MMCMVQVKEKGTPLRQVKSGRVQVPTAVHLPS